MFGFCEEQGLESAMLSMEGHRALRDETFLKSLETHLTGDSVQRSPLAIGPPSSEGSCFTLCMRSVQGKVLKTLSKVPMVRIFNSNRTKVQGVASTKIRVTLHARLT
jgi:hypothetical protein